VKLPAASCETAPAAVISSNMIEVELALPPTRVCEADGVTPANSKLTGVPFALALTCH
jgi:hypothetical protein